MMALTTSLQRHPSTTGLRSAVHQPLMVLKMPKPKWFGVSIIQGPWATVFGHLNCIISTENGTSILLQELLKNAGRSECTYSLTLQIIQWRENGLRKDKS